MRFKNNFTKTAKQLINSAGYDVAYLSVTFGQYNPLTLSAVNTETTYLIKAAPMRNSYMDSQSPAYVDKIIKTYIISSLDLPVAPKAGDRIVTHYSIVTVSQVKPYEFSGGAAAWKVICTKD